MNIKATLTLGGVVALVARTLEAQTAEQYKLMQTRMGEGEAARRAAVLNADGALAQKLDALVKINETWAKAFAEYRGDVVPRITSSANNGGQNGALDFMTVMGMKAANDLALDMKIQAAPAKK